MAALPEPRGHWSLGIFLEAPEIGTYATPTSWLPMTGHNEPSYPASVGTLLHRILTGPDQPGTHTFRLPATEHDDDGEPLPQPVKPTLTVERILREVRDEAQAFAIETTGRLLLYGPDIDQRLWDRNVDRALLPPGPGQLNLQAPRAPVRTDSPRRMQPAHPHRTRRPKPGRRDVVDRRQAPDQDR